MKYLVTGDVIIGAFVHEIEADSEEDAIAKVNELSTGDLDSVSSEHEFPSAQTAEEVE